MYNLCIGTAQFGMSYGIANTSGKLSYCQVKQIIKTATENKIFYYDTAPVYGDSEKLLGQAISEYGINKEVRLISKIPPNLTSLTKLQKQVEESLNRLKIKDYWGFLCHRYEDLNNDIIEYSMFLKDKKIIKTNKLQKGLMGLV